MLRLLLNKCVSCHVNGNSKNQVLFLSASEVTLNDKGKHEAIVIRASTSRKIVKHLLSNKSAQQIVEPCIFGVSKNIRYLVCK